MDPIALEQTAVDNNQEHDSQTTTDANGASSKVDNKFQTAIAAWRNIDLTNLIPTLDSAASDLVAHQRDSLVERKELAQKTKDFRKLDDSVKLGEVKGLLKAYQTYIDLITNQSKAIHSAFLQVYSPLSEAPDPYPLLEASIDSLVTAEEVLPKITEENQQLQRTVNRLTTQLEETEKKLGTERTARQTAENSRDDKIKGVEASWTAVLNEKQNNWDAKRRTLEEKTENQERLLKEVQANFEVSTRLNKGENGELEGQSRAASAAELEIVSSELDRANLRLAEVEARNEQLSIELAQSASNSADGSQRRGAVEDDPAFLRLQSENSSLLRRLENSRFEKEADKRKVAGDLRQLEREVGNLKKDNEALKGKIAQWSDYENVKKELEVLKSIEFATGDDDDAPENDDIPLPTVEGDSKKPETLEHLLLTRNKKLSNELTLLRVSHNDLSARLTALQAEHSTSTADLAKSKQLVETLEADLEKVQSEAENAFPSSAMSVAGTYTSRYPQSSYHARRPGRATSPTSSIISGFDPQHSQFDSSSSPQPGGGPQSSILPMVTAQRDRFKRKLADLEAELQKSYGTVSSLRAEVAGLQRDNLSLYEKARWQAATRNNSQAYVGQNDTTIQISGNAQTSSGMSLAPNANQGGIGGVDNRYRSAYAEATLTPFSAFKSREASRLLRRMAWPERAVFRIAKGVLATRLSRNLFAGYCLVLHVMVLALLLQGAGGGGVGVAGMAAPGVRGGGEGVGAGKVEWRPEGVDEKRR